MSLHNVFELIRKEEAIFWVGAGFSKYAGFPLGGELASIIYDSLSIEEKRSISKSIPLPELCEAYVCARSRNQLIQLLRKIFERTPASLVHHKRLAQIPLVKTIVTTNYDNLFEIAFGGEMQKVLNNIDTSYIDDNKLTFFKAHGDLNDPNSVVITTSDYNTAIDQETQKSSYWSCIKSRIVNKAIIMLGYSLTDPNINLLFDQINRELQGNRKEIYLLAPGFDKNQRKRLEAFGVKYIDMKGEVFVQKLQQNIYDNIIKDFNNEKLKPETLSKILSKKNLYPEFKTDSSGRLILKSINSSKGKINVKATFKANANDELLKNFSAFSQGRSFGHVEFDNTRVEDFKFTLNGINFTPNNEFKFLFTSLPTEHGSFDVIFEDGFELNDVAYEVFKSAYLAKIICNYKSSRLTIDCSLDNNPTNTTNFRYEQVSNFRHVKEAIEICHFLQRLAESLSLTIYPKERDGPLTFKMPLEKLPLEEFEASLEYYSSLKKVEILYNIRFNNIAYPKQVYYDRAQYLIKFSQPVSDFLHDEFEFEIVDNRIDTINKLKEVYEGNKDFEVVTTTVNTLEIHGKMVLLGQKVIEMHWPYTLNLDELVRNESNVVRISTTKEVTISYRK
jgi:hypothetical protein